MSASWPCCAVSRIPPWLPRTSSMPISGPTDCTPISRRRPVPTSIGRRSRSDASPRRSEAPQDAAIFFPMRLIAVLAVLTGLAASPPLPPGYRILVASESGDIVTQLTWDGTALAVAKVVPVGIMPADIDGPHNVTVAPDGSAWYVSIAHGTPYGSLWKMSAGSDTLLGRAQLEMFPTTIALTPDGTLAFVANSDFHGDHPRTNLVSIVQTATMTPLTNLPACDMPHGVKVNHAGSFVYVSCMNSDEILEIDRQTLHIRRRHKTGVGMAMGAMPAHTAGPAAAAPGHDCSPTFVSVSPDDRRLYVARSEERRVGKECRSRWSPYH